MRKFLLFLAIASICIACAEITPMGETMVTISFDTRIVSGHQMTRADENTFLQIIEEQTPSYVNVTLKNVDSEEVYTCVSNESITIPIGNYDVSAEYVGTEFEEPNLKCDIFNIDITHEISTISLNTYYNCYAIFALIDECVCRYEKTGTLYEIPLPQYDEEYYIGYFSDDRVFNLQAKGDAFIDTSFEFSVSGANGKIHAELGKYYVLHPDGNPNVSSGFTITLPPMVEGEL